MTKIYYVAQVQKVAQLALEASIIVKKQGDHEEQESSADEDEWITSLHRSYYLVSFIKASKFVLVALMIQLFRAFFNHFDEKIRVDHKTQDSRDNRSDVASHFPRE